MVYSCKKCNRAKSNKYYGPLETNKLRNTLFYEPTEVDYNEIFFRNTLGGIDSNDSLGKIMIVELQLYRLSHNYAWLTEELDKVQSMINTKLETLGENDETKVTWTEIHSLIAGEAAKLKKFFIETYNL